MSDNNKIQLFENQPIRTAWDEEQEEWYFSIVDVMGVLTEQKTPRSASTYWAVLKKRLKDEGADQLLTNCKQLKMKATDGKRRLTDVASTEQLLRIIQSIPSPKAEPFKLWLARIGTERIEETIDPEQAIDRALEVYQKKGYSDEWIHQRILSIRVRNALTDEWQKSGGEAASEARKAVEARTGVSVITSQNATPLNAVVTNMIESMTEFDTNNRTDTSDTNIDPTDRTL